MSRGGKPGQGQLWTPERIDKLSELVIARRAYSHIAGIMGVTRNSVAGAVDRYLNKDGTVRSYARQSAPRPRRNATIEELQAPKVHKWRDEVPAGTPSPSEAKPKKTIQWSVLQNGFTRNADPARALKAGIVQRPSEARVTLPRVSIQRRDDFSDADVRAGSADRAWTEREMAE